MVKSPNQEEKRFRRFDMHRMCKTIDMLAGMYSPEHPQRMRPPPLAIMYQPGLCKSDVAATYSKESDKQSALASPPTPTRTEILEQPRAMSPIACTQSSDREASALALVCRPPTSGIIPFLSYDCPDQRLFMCEPTKLESSENSDGNMKKKSESDPVHIASLSAASMSQPELHKSDVAATPSKERNASDTQSALEEEGSNPVHDANPNNPLHAQGSALQPPPSIVSPNIADKINPA